MELLGLSHWWVVALVIEGLSLVAWLLILRTRRLQPAFVVGFNAILPLTLVHLLGGGPLGWRSWAALTMVAFYLVRMNWVIFVWTPHTALSKLDRKLSAAEKHILPFALTNIAGWLYCLPFYFLARRDGPADILDVLAICVYGVGSVLHAAADLEKKRFKERPDSAGCILDSGLWAWSRHPNYFGDFLIYVSWAIFAGHPWGWVAPAANLLQYVFDAIPKNEAWAAERYGSAWTEYARRTSRFVPRPPRP